MCVACFTKAWDWLAYVYRRDVPKAALPAAVARREDCYWGRTCRTQTHKPSHAQRLNHVCEASRK